MQDRYLFRGKRLDNGAWEIGTLVIERMYTSEERYFIADKMTGYHTPVDPATIGQCTGLKDKNGRLIFEGDIARTSKGLILAVHYNKAQYELGNKERDGYFVLSIYKPEELEVIGNIHGRTDGEA